MVKQQCAKKVKRFLALVLAFVLVAGSAGSVFGMDGETDNQDGTIFASQLTRRPISEPWDRNIQTGRWTISDMGAGGAMPVIGQGPDGLLVVGSDLSGLWISDDDGLNFRNAGSYHGLTSLGVFALALSPADGNTFFAGTYGYLYSTFDGGFTFYNNASMLGPNSDGWYHDWLRPDGGQGVPFWTAITVSSCGEVVYAAYNSSWAGHTSRIFISKDGGRTFNPDDVWLVNADNGASDTMRIQKMMTHPNDPNVLFILSAGDSQVQWGEQNGVSTNGIFKSVLDGTNVTWKPIDGGHETLVAFEGAEWSPQFFRDMVFDPTNPDILYISADGNAAGGSAEGNWGASAGDGEARPAGLFAVNTADNTMVSSIVMEGQTWGPGYVSIAQNAEGSKVLRVILRGNSPAVREIIIDSPGMLPDELPEATEVVRINPVFPGVNIGTAISFTKGNAQSMYNSDIYFTTGSQWINIMDFTGSEPTIEQAFTNRIDDIGHDRGTYRGRGISNVVPHHVAIDHHDTNIIYAAHADIGFEFTLDGGASWTRSNHRALSSAWGPTDGDPNDSTGRGGGALYIAPDPNVPGRVWTAYGYETFDKMIIRSDDNGATWTVPANEGLPIWNGELGNGWSSTGVANSDEFFRDIFRGGRILSIAIDPNSPDIYAPTMFATVSRATWHFTWNSWAFRDAEAAFAQGYDIYRSDDGAESWTKLDITSATHDVFMYVAIDPEDRNIVYVGAQDGLHRSDDGGDTWTRVLHIPSLENYSEMNHTHEFSFAGYGFDGYPDSGYNYIGVRGISVSASNPDVVFVAAGLFTGDYRHSDPIGSGIYRSTDRGLTFERVYVDPDRTRNLDQFTTSVAVHPTNPNIVFAGASSVTRSGGHNPRGYIALSTDGGRNWSFINEGLGTPVVGSIAISPTEPNTVWISVQGSSMQKRLFTLHTITFDSTGGSAAGNAVTHHDTGQLTTLPTPARAGYTFNGWFTSETGGTQITAATVFSEDAVVFAQWAVGQAVQNAPVSRAMAVQELFALEGSPDVSGLANPFADVAENSPYADAVMWAAANGIVSGFRGGGFGPDDNITQAHLAIILTNYIEFAGLTLQVAEVYQVLDPNGSVAGNELSVILERLTEAAR